MYLTEEKVHPRTRCYSVFLIAVASCPQSEVTWQDDRFLLPKYSPSTIILTLYKIPHTHLERSLRGNCYR